MTVDERVRSALRDAASDRVLDQELALHAVRARVGPAELVEQPRRARGALVTAALAACVLLASAVAVPVAMRSVRDSPGPLASSGRCGHDVAHGYRSTAVVRLLSASPGAPVELDEPVAAALGLCDAVLRRAHAPAGDIHFAAGVDGHMLSLTVTASTASDSDGLARAWAQAFVDARRVAARNQAGVEQRRLIGQVHRVHDELLRVDERLEHLAPDVYGDVVRVDAPSGLPGRTRPTVPPVPERGTVQVLNLAYERIALLARLSQAVTKSGEVRVTQANPAAYASVVRVSSPSRLPASNHESTSTVVLVLLGILGAGALLAAGGVRVGGRSRRPQSP